MGPGGLAFIIHGCLSAEEADALAAVSESIGYSQFAPGIRTPVGCRRNKAVTWFATEDTAGAFLRPLYARFRHLLPERIEGARLHSKLSRRMAHIKYDDGDVFNRHTDGAWPGQFISESGVDIDEWPGVESKLTMLLYLNDESDGVRGGHTRLFRFDGGEPVDVAPRKGSALFFRHGFGSDSVMHMGTEVSGTVPKYVLRLTPCTVSRCAVSSCRTKSKRYRSQAGPLEPPQSTAP